MQPSIDITDVSVRYSNGHQALDNVSFSLKGAQVCALVGMNGSGKSTLFKSMMGLVKPQQGKISYSDKPIKKALSGQQVAYVPQSEEIDWHFPVSVKDVVMMGRYGYMNFLRQASDNDHQIVKSAMVKLGIFHLADRQIGELSGGQKKRVFLARALAQQSPIILLDEPFTGIDAATEQSIMELLIGLRDKGQLIFISTHNLGTIPEFCDQVVLLNRAVIATGATKEVFTESNLSRVFGGALRQVEIPSATVTVVTDDERPAIFHSDRD
uniref:metal ABC transporter ATP-binding protein n=1 Tax=Thaumasiovibrio occultus TaxID=1891184 RepID=UPI000B356A31|nr:metal ABC transporter ATP-binding protein [Thaumasiovibrio occultus]